MLFWEFRIFVSLLLLLYLWYFIGFVDQALKYIIVCDLKRILGLPVSIDNVELSLKVEDINGSESFHLIFSQLISHCSFPSLKATVYIRGLKVKSPPVEVDDRWDTENIIAVSLITVRFLFFKSLYLYIVSFTELIFVESVRVTNMRMNVEGHRRLRSTVSEGTMTNSDANMQPSEMKTPSKSNISAFAGPEEATDFNILLLGRARRRYKKKVHHAAVGVTPDMLGTIPAAPRTPIKKQVSAPLLPLPPAAAPSSATALGSPLSFFQMVSKATVGAIKEIESGKLNVDKYLKEKVSDIQQKISTTVSEIKVEAANFNNSVASAGLLQATKYKINEVYAKTKRQLEESVLERIASLHVKFCGSEPERTPGETRVMCAYVLVDCIEIFMRKVLPIQLRHIEQKPLRVFAVRISDLGLGKPPLVVSGGSCKAEEALTTVRSTSGSDMIGSTSVNGINTHCNMTTSTSAAAVAERDAVKMRSASAPDITLNLPIAEVVVDNEQKLHGQAQQAEKEADEALWANWASSAVDTVEVWDKEMSVYSAGLDMAVVKYRCERALLLGIYSCNAGRLLYDVFQFERWNPARGFSFSTNTNNANNITQSSSTPSDEDVGLDAVTYSSRHPIRVTHPLFFDS